MNKLLLRLVMLPAGLYRRAGADVRQLRALLEVRLKLDDRRPLTLGRARQQKKPTRFTSFWTAFISFFTGVIYVMPLVRLEASLMLGLWGYFTMFLVMLSFLLVTDFSNVLLDTRDKFIVTPRPVSDRTVLMARLLHIFIYLTRVILPMSIAGWVVLGAFYDWRLALWFPLALLLLMATALFLVMGLYLAMMKLATPARFKNVLNGFQILTSILLFSLYYLVPTLMRDSHLATLTLAQAPWVKAFPSFWIAATAIVVKPALGLSLWPYAVAAIVFPALALWVTLRYLAPAFVRQLAAIDSGESMSETAAPAVPGKPVAQGYGPRLARLLNRGSEGRAGFLLAWLQTGRSRTFRMRVYPTFAYVPVYFIYTLFISSKEAAGTVWHALPGTARHLGLLYMSAFVLLQVQSYLMISDQYKASWVYQAAPLRNPGELLAGAFKAIYIKYFLPFFVAIAAFVLYTWGRTALWDVALAWINVTASVLAMARFQYRYLPFSRMEQMREKGSRVFRVLGGMLVPFSLGLMHYLLYKAANGFVEAHVGFLRPLLYAVCLLMAFALLALLWGGYRKTTWQDIRVFEEEA